MWPEHFMSKFESKCMNFYHCIARFSEQRVERASTTTAVTARPAPSFRVSVPLITVCSHLCGLKEISVGQQPTQADSGTVCIPKLHEY